MLPDFPKVRKFADEILMNWFRRRVFQKSGVMQDIPAEVLHEGNRVELHRYDGSVQVISMKPTASELRLEKNEFQKKGLGAVIRLTSKRRQLKPFLSKQNCCVRIGQRKTIDAHGG